MDFATAYLLVALPFHLQFHAVATVGAADDATLDILKCWVPCNFGFTGFEVLPMTGCAYYHECWEGVGVLKSCGPPLVFNDKMEYCDFPSEVACMDFEVVCPENLGGLTQAPVGPIYSARPTKRPTRVPTGNPTLAPSSVPATRQPTPAPIEVSEPPTISPSEHPTELPTKKASLAPTENTVLPTENPTMVAITISPTLAPISNPTSQPTNPPTGPPTRHPTTEAPTPLVGTAMAHIESKKEQIENIVLVSYNSASGLASPSKTYTYDKFLQSLQIMGVTGFGADFSFLLWEGNIDKYHYGLVNVAAFLANAMVEAIELDTCDELNWQTTKGMYALSNSCGQYGRSYQHENCARGSTEFMSCAVDPRMQVSAVGSGTQARAPPPLMCRPRRGAEDVTGYWDATSGRDVGGSPFSNAAGRTGMEGCCWWGRGALLTKGICQIGKLNYFLGKRGADLGRSTLYPTIDFCLYPEVTCTSVSRSLQWTTALFEWSERVQRYDLDGWNFEEQLTTFVDGGLAATDGDAFFDSVCRILSRGCHAAGCTEEVRMLNKRKSNFVRIINEVLDLPSLLGIQPISHQPTQMSPVTPTQPSVSMTPAPPADLPVVSPPQEIPILPNTPNSSASPVAQPEQSLVSSGDMVVAQPELSLSSSGDMVGATTGDELIGDNMIGIQETSAGRIPAKQAFQPKMLTVASIIYCYIILK